MLTRLRLVVCLSSLVAAVSGCNCDPPPTGMDAGPTVDAGPTADAGPGDSGTVDSGMVEDAGLPADAGQPMDAGADGGLDAGAPVALMDYVPCTLDIDCPSGFGRCLRNLPLHHPDVTGAAAVPTSTVFRGLAAGQGVCAESCDQDPTVCSTSPNLTRSVSFSCQVVYSGTSPYQLGTASDAGAMRQGVTFAALCRPPLVTTALCAACTTNPECGQGTCWDFSADAGFTGTGPFGTCVLPCGQGDACPAGFSCESRGATRACFPLQATCGACRDLDKDGFGLGFCGAPDSMGNPTVSSVDCDDGNAQAYWLAQLQCGPVDRDCNGFIDSIDMVGTDAFGAQHCASCNDACPTAVNATIPGLSFACVGPVGNRACVPSCNAGLLDCDANPDCEVGPTTPGRQWAPDVDGDGFSCNATPGNAACPSVTACVAPVVDGGTYATSRALLDGGSPATCSSATACPDADDSRNVIFPGAAERCDGLDNDQDGFVDDGFVMNGALVCTNGTLPTGTTCSAGMRVGIGSACTTTCGTITGPGTWRCGGTGGVVCQPNTANAEVACNGIDDNCDGRVDEPVGDACTRPANTLPSPCWEAARTTCQAGSAICQQASPTPFLNALDVPGDGYDSDCDGTDSSRWAIYVWSGSLVPSPTGSRTAPFVSLDQAATAISNQLSLGRPAIIHLQDSQMGSTTLPIVTQNTISLRSRIHYYGGFTGSTSWTPPSPTSTATTKVCLPRSANANVVWQMGTNTGRGAWLGLRCEQTRSNETPPVFRNIELQVAVACNGASTEAPRRNGFGNSVYGAFLRDCEDLILNNVSIVTGPAQSSDAAEVGKTGARGSDGSSSASESAGGFGGAGSTSPAVFGANGSSLAPPGRNTAGGVGGGPNQGGAAPTSAMFGGTGARGSSGVPNGPATILFPLPVLSPTPRPMLYLDRTGVLRSGAADWHLGGSGGTGAWGPGGGGGGMVFAGFAFRAGGNGGQGGGGGNGGGNGQAGGDNVGLVLLGTQLFNACPAPGPLGTPPSFTPCASNVRVNQGSGGAGGAGGVGGNGGIGGAGTIAPVGFTIGGNGGRGCGGGGGAGGRGGMSVGLVYDVTSTPQGQLPPWLTLQASGSAGTGGLGAMSGSEGTGFGDNRCTTDGGLGASGYDGTALPAALVPLRNCNEALGADSDRPDGGFYIVLQPDGVTPVSRTCP